MTIPMGRTAKAAITVNMFVCEKYRMGYKYMNRISNMWHIPTRFLECISDVIAI